MGRPRKRRREEEDHTSYDSAPINGMGSDPLDTSIDDFSSIGYQIFDPPSPERSKEYQDKPAAEEGDVPTGFESENLKINFQSIHMPDFDLTVPLPIYDSPQNFSTYPPLEVLDPNLLQPTLSLGNNTASAILTTTTTANPTQTSCTCLPTLYSTLSTFQSPPPPSFPYSMGHLRSARQCAHTVVHCPICPEAYNTTVQNSMLLCTLLQMIINEYAKLLAYIDERASSGEKITYRLGEVADTLDTRHTGGPDCPMGINLDLEGEEWRMLARKGVRAEVRESGSDNRDGQGSLLDILQEMRDRQERWHSSFPKERHAHAGRRQDVEGKEPLEKKGECMCTQILHIDQLKRALEALDI